jgi:hypothetical protein
MTTTTIATIAISTLLGTYDTNEVQLSDMVGGVLSPEQVAIHQEQYNGNPDYRRLVTGNDFAMFAKLAESEPIGARFSVRKADYTLRMNPSEPETLITVATIKVHNKRTLESELLIQMFRYQNLADFIGVDWHKGTCYITVSRSEFGGGF